MRLAASKRGDPLHEVKHAFRRATFLVQHCFDDFHCLGLGEPALAQEAIAVLVATGDDPLARGPDPGNEWRGRGIGPA